MNVFVPQPFINFLSNQLEKRDIFLIAVGPLKLEHEFFLVLTNKLFVFLIKNIFKIKPFK